MRKPSLEACFNSNLSNTDKDLNFGRNFFQRKKTSMTDEQQKVVDEWEKKICGDGAGLCPAIDADFARLLTILENRQDDLRQMQKTSLEACFNSSLSNADKDLNFCKNFFQRKKTNMTDEQQKVVDEWEEKICGDGAGLCPAIDADFTRLLTILENRQDDLRQMQKTSFEACFNSSLSNTDKDLKFCQNFFKRKKTVWQMNSKRLWMNGRRRFVAMVRGCVLPSMQISRACLLYLKTVKMTCNKCKKQVSKHVSTAAWAIQTRT